MKFQYNSFSCDTEIFSQGNNLVVRFYDSSKEPRENQIVDYVAVNPGYGYICLKFKGEDAILSGYLDKEIFIEEKMVGAAINFVEKLSPLSEEAYIPYRVELFEKTTRIEYTGE